MQQLLKQVVFPHLQFHSRRTRMADVLGNSVPHYHDFYEIFLVEEGPLLHHINGECETIYPDTMVFVHPEDQHFFSRKDKGSVQFFNLAFAEDQFERAMELAAQCTPEVRELPLLDKVVLPHELSRLLLRRMKWLRDVNKWVPLAVQEAEGVTLLAELLVLFTVGSGNTHIVPFWLRKACDAMYQPENLVVGLPRLVELSGKTQEHVTRSMRRYMGQTPSGFINAIRLERVAEALTTTDRPIFDIMLDVGFQNTSHFNKLFKEKYRMSPRKYRATAVNILGRAE